MDRFAAALATRPLWAVGILLVLLALAVSGWREEAPDSPWMNDPSWDSARKIHQASGLGEVAGWIAVFGEVDTGPQALAVLEAVEAEFEALPWISQLITPLDMPGANYRSGLETLQHPLAGPLFGNQGGYFLPFLWDPEGGPLMPNDWEERQTLAAQAGLVRAEVGPEWEVGITGPGAVIRAQNRAFQRERKVYTLGGTLFVFLLASVVFRNVRAVFLSGLGPLLGVVVAVGISRRLGLAASGFTAVVLPLLILTIGFTDSLHLVLSAARIQRQAQGRLSPGSAAAEAVRELALPCALTSLTTAIGFGSMALASNEVIVQFGLSCALATLLAFVCVLLAVPCLAYTPLGRALEQMRVSEATNRRTRWPLRFTLARPRIFASIAFLLTLSLAWGAAQLKVDRYLTDDLARGSKAGLVMARCDAAFGGVFPLHVSIDWDPGVSMQDVWSAAAAARDVLNAEPDLGRAVSVVEAVRGLAPGGGAMSTFLGPAMLAGLPKAWSRVFIDLEDRFTVVHTRMPDKGSATSKRTFDSIRTRLDDFSKPGLRLSLTGMQLAQVQTLDGVAHELGRSLAIAACLILVTLGLAFRSWRLAIASAIPNTLPVVASAAGLVWFQGGANLSTLTALTLALGIAADDTIHVLARWQSARRLGLGPSAAAEHAIQHTLPALAMTTLCLTAAFGLLVTSSIPTIASFGLLVAVTLVVAFFADVLLLPALLVALAKN